MNKENEKPESKDDFYAVVSAIARFIETADSDNEENRERKL